MFAQEELTKGPYFGFLGKSRKEEIDHRLWPYVNFRGDGNNDFSEPYLVTIDSYLLLSKRRFSTSRQRSEKIARKFSSPIVLSELVGHKIMYGKMLFIRSR